MAITINEKVSRILLGTFLLVAIVQNIVVADRVLAAIWFHYKFSGFGNDGYITLGKQTAWIFYGLSITMLAISTALAMRTSIRSWAKWVPGFLFVCGLTAYSIVAWSPLNQWRP